MRFEARDLKSYAEPVTFDDLEEGVIYFALTFIDEQMLIPRLDTVVYVGLNLSEGDDDQVYFQDIDSYRLGTRFDSPEGEGAVFYSGSKNEVNHFFDYEQMLDQFLACSVRRQKAGCPNRRRADE